MSAGNLAREEARTRSHHITVDTYEVSVDVSQSRNREIDTFPTVSTVQFASTTTSTWLDFLDGKVTKVVVNDVEVDVDYDGSRIQLTGLRTDGPNRVTVVGEGTYSRSGQGLHRFFDPVDGQTYLYTQYEPADSRRVFANFEQPDLKGRFTFSLVGPSDWQMVSNQAPAHRETVSEGIDVVTFAPTPLQSTYITCLCAGPYIKEEGSWSGHGLDIPMAAYCRASLKDHFDGEEILKLTGQGLEFFNANFGFPYPWGKYDSIFVPEYNLGAMENPGLVTFTEDYIFRSQAVRAQYTVRANTLQHEMSHMWFGDLVTPQWWDDLWLKESFAEYMGAHCAASATEYTDAWVQFGGARKAWAIMQDQLPSTHPIVADIPDLEAAKQNFDGITYAKGAAVLKQLVKYVGVDEFFAGTREYFQLHAFSSSTLDDLLAVLERASGRDLGEWAKRWLQTSGVDTLRPVVESADGTVTSLRIEQTSIDTQTGEEAHRPHRIAVGLYYVRDGALVREHVLEVDVLDGADVPDAVGLPAPDLVLVNDGDHTYAKVRLDAKGLATALAHVGDCADPLARTLLWGALWDMTRDGELPAADYVAAVAAHGDKETDSSTLSQLTGRSVMALGAFTQAEDRAAHYEKFAAVVWDKLFAAEPGSDQQVIWARAFAGTAARVPSAVSNVRALLSGESTIEGLTLSPEIRWSLTKALAAQGECDEQGLAEELERDSTNDGIAAHASAMAGRPLASAKQETWDKLMTPRALTNDHVKAMLEGFQQPAHAELVAPYRDTYFASLVSLWAEHPIEIGLHLVAGLFPRHVDAVAGQSVDEHPVVVAAQSWLDAHADAPGALRRIVSEELDHARRALRAQLASIR